MVYQKTRAVLRQRSLAPKKRLGQNFLVHRHTAERIVQAAGFTSSDQVLEVGVGLGALTRPLAAVAKMVVGLEKDRGIIRMHEEEQDLPDNVVLIHGDILKVDWQELAAKTGGRLQIIANLPYSISSPFLFRLLHYRHLVESAVLMLQKEVGLRLLAESGTKEYGALTVLMQSFARIEPLLQIKAGEFYPRPKVDSMVIRLTVHPVPERVQQLGSFDRQLFRTIVNRAFGQRRKTLLNAIGGLDIFPDKAAARHTIVAAGIAPTVRAEQLDIMDFIRLANTFAASRPRLAMGQQE